MGARTHRAGDSLTDYLLSQRDSHNLVCCQAKGVDMHGISSWRNIIPYYTLDGAVTEINAEAVYALEAAAMLCAVVGDNDHWEKYGAEARSMRTAMMDYLFNDDTGAFVLNYDQDGNYQDNFTADEIFPVLFGVADSTQRQAILSRLKEADFVTPVGLRTISTADAWYFPSYGFGLLGGIWPDLTLWFAVALARNGMTDDAVHFLTQTYGTMEAGSPRNTVPGEFAEWFDGGSLSNRGMYLSPWTGAKFLWAVAETVGGLNGYRTSGRPHLAPLRPAGWKWVAAARVHWGGRRCTYVVDLPNDTIYANMPELSAEEPFTCIYAGRDVSDEVTISPVEVGAIAFEDDAGAVRIFVGNLLDRARDVLLEFRGHTARVNMAAGELREVHLIGKPSDRRARAAKLDVVRPLARSMRFPTVVLAAGAAVLLIAVAVGQRMGDRVMQQATQQQLQSVLPTPLPSGADASPQPYGPDWKRSQSLSAAADPRFPDPRVPPKPLPTPPPPPKATAAPVAPGHPDAESQYPDLAPEAAADLRAVGGTLERRPGLARGWPAGSDADAVVANSSRRSLGNGC